MRQKYIKIFMIIYIISKISYILVPALSVTTEARSQTSNPSVVVDADGQCPDLAVLRSFPGVTQPTEGIGTTLVKVSGASLYQSQDTESALVYVYPLFGNELIVYGFSENGSRLFVRVRDEATACGWAAVSDLLLPRANEFKGLNKTPQPLQMRDVSKSHKGNLLNVKAVIHDLSVAGNQGIDVYEDPASDKATKKITLFDTFAVYAQIALNKPRLDGETRFWLIGNQNAKDGVRLEGWVRQKDVVIWPTRLAVQWNGEAQVEAFGTPENLTHNQNPVAAKQNIQQVDFKNKITRRLPVLEQEPPPEDVLAKIVPGASLEARRATAKETIKYYKVAAPGEACRRDGSQDDCWEARETDKARESLVKASLAARKMDVLVLIDGTESMDIYFEPTVKAIRHFMEEVSNAAEQMKRQSIDPRFGVSLYGDYKSNSADPNEVDFNPVVPLFSPTLDTLREGGPLSALTENPKGLIFADVHKDKLEAPFAAIMRAAGSTRWRPLREVPLRFIVHLADAGNRDYGKTSRETMLSRFPEITQVPPNSTIKEAVREEDVISALKKNSVIYIPVAVLESGVEDASAYWYPLLQDQSNSILAKLGRDAIIKRTIVTDPRKEIKALTDQVLTTVKQVFENLGGTTQRVSDTFESHQCGSNDKSDRCIALQERTKTNPEAILKLVNRIAFESGGLSPEQVSNIYSREQSILTLYIPALSSNGRETFSHWVALDEMEFRRLRELLQELCQAMNQQDARNPVMRALTSFTGMYGNEDLAGATFGEILGKRLGIPNLERTDFSSRTRDEVDDAYRAWSRGTDTNTWNIWHERVCRAETFTRFMEDGIRVKYEDISCDLKSATCHAPRSAQTKFQWSIQVNRGAPVFYMPLDLLP